jgi:hypothetical protein
MSRYEVESRGGNITIELDRMARASWKLFMCRPSQPTHDGRKYLGKWESRDGDVMVEVVY